MTFGEALQQIRRAKGIKQRQVANAIAMDFSYYSKLENDRLGSSPTRETIDKIADALNCDADERNELLVAAGRSTEEIERASRISREDPEMRKSLGRLFKAAVHLSPEDLDKWAEKVERERQRIEEERLKAESE